MVVGTQGESLRMMLQNWTINAPRKTHSDVMARSGRKPQPILKITLGRVRAIRGDKNASGEGGKQRLSGVLGQRGVRVGKIDMGEVKNPANLFHGKRQAQYLETGV